MSKLTILGFILFSLISVCVGQATQTGQCDLTVPTVANFNAAQFFRDTWYDIESNAPFQTGTCNTAQYTLRADSTVELINSQVVNEGLVTVSGTGVSQYNDGSARFLITITQSSGTQAQSPYWVIDTDYTTFALVYSCTNVGTTQRTVSSWKLSRTQTGLTSDAIIRINAAIATVAALSPTAPNSFTYTTRSHTAAACFYYPVYTETPATIDLPGVCPTTITGANNFNALTFAGTWIEVARYPNTDQTGQCNRAVYGPLANGVISVTNNQVRDGNAFSISGEATVLTASGQLEVRLPITSSETRTLVVLATDNTNYALLYSCVNVGTGRRVTSWKLRKDGVTLTDAHNTAMNNLIQQTQGLRDEYYVQTLQTEAACFVYPVYDVLPEVIELDGACATVQGVANFNVQRYLGTWQEIARYPQPTQTGQCNRAEYGLLTDGVVSVRNSQVVNGGLSTISGEARVVSTDGTGQIEVTFIVGGEERRSILYVLATDYDNYALVYSCTPVANQNRRQVGSWKLQKAGGTITAAHNAEMDRIISETGGLREEYYQQTLQTEAACFVYPVYDVLPEVIELDGACATVTGVANFNVQSYLGTWHEVARYPQPTQTGQCNRAEYGLLTDGVVSVRNSQVVNGGLSTISGEARVVSTDGTGQIEVTFIVGGEERRSILYVLATDYDNYALVYSCTPVPNQNRRQVGSWKLQKAGGTITAAHNAEMDRIISETGGLREEYYQQTLQTEAACFVYPVYDVLPEVIELDGACATVTGVANFNVQSYLGTWHEVARYPQPTQTGQCNRAEYGLLTDGVVSVRNSQVVNGGLSTISGEARVVSTDGTGQIEVTFIVGGEERRSILYVLATDYDNYALVYSCTPVPNQNRRQVGSWKLQKAGGTITAAHNAEMDRIISETGGLREEYYQQTLQTEAACFVYPVYDVLPEVIELDGACATVTGVANFNVQSYLGTWHEVARYPQPTQTGQCNRAEYGLLTDGVVSVRNSQVVNEALSTISGEARVVSTDGTGQIEVTFIVGGEERKSILYVLATDYNNYALVYSCTPVPNQNRRQVGSWKLQKAGGTITAAHNAEMDRIISETGGLREEYYQQTLQTEAACFYYPVYDEPPTYIELRGSCDTNVKGVENFNPTAYTGTWLEIARYPQGTQTGQCNRAHYGEVSEGAVPVLNSQVINQVQYTISGQARVVSTEGYGDLEVTFTVNGELRTSNYYVLATDYTEYALVYSCRNLDNGYRRVGSWKLTRTATLSAQSETAINNAMSQIKDLKEEYYQTTDQSFNACFHYPTEVDDNVILVGQCDKELSVKTDFDVAKFATNVWYHIKSYESVEGSTCAGTRLSYDAETEEIKIINFEVINNELKLQESTGKLNTTDNSGRFAVTVPAENDEVKETYVYILDTDYDDYALAFSCNNVDGNTRQVKAWQLSRERQLSEDGEKAIADLIEKNIEGLYEPYFNDVEQKDDCPVPASAFLFKSSIMVIFVCAILQLLS